MNSGHLIILWALALFSLPVPVGALEQAPGEHGAHPHDKPDHVPEVKLTPAQRRAAGITVEPLRRRPVGEAIDAPGEVRRDAYRTSQVAPRITAQVVARHARLGERVGKGRPLVTLSSVTMAEAQGAMLVAAQEWARVRKLGRKVVSDRRYTEARVAHAQARARLRAYGLSDRLTDGLLAGNTPPDGTFDLLAPQAGTVIRDDFVRGEFVSPGRMLFEISDESRVWVEARLTALEAAHVELGAPVQVHVGPDTFAGKVVQLHHALDEATRTLPVRIEVANPAERLHPGMFVQTRIESDDATTENALPARAVLRAPDGDRVVFVELSVGRFRMVPIEVRRTVGDLVIIEGIEPGTAVVTRGGFFLQSELAKSGFQVHNH